MDFVVSVLALVGLLFTAVFVVLRLADLVLRPSSGGLWSARGRVVLITGASSGIGEELARQYARLGARLVLAARRGEELQRVKALITEEVPDAEVETVVADVADPDQCRAAVSAAGRRFEALDLVVLNAGISMSARFDEMQLSEPYRRIFDVNVFGVMSVILRAFPLLYRSPHARICIISSGAGKLGVPTRTAYSASKFALHGFSDALRIELQRRGIAVTVACPGPVQTNINKSRIAATGGVGKSFDMEKAQAVDEACEQIIAGVRRGDRETLVGSTSYRFKVAATAVVRAVAPSLVDHLLVRECRRTGIM